VDVSIGSLGLSDRNPSTGAVSDYSSSIASGVRHTRTASTSQFPISDGIPPIRWGVHSIQNLRKEMEDTHHIVLGAKDREESGEGPEAGSDKKSDLGPFTFFAVFDGHGGVQAAEFASERLYSHLSSAYSRAELEQNPTEALRVAILDTESDWIAHARENELMDGTTMAVVLVDRTIGRCVVGNVGDSEVVLGERDAQSDCIRHRVLTEVHHMKRNPAELTRVLAAGGREWRGRLGHPKYNPQVVSIAVSRAVGDLFFKDAQFTDGKPSGLVADPFVQSADIGATDDQEQFLILGCDGMWDKVTYEQAVAFVLERFAFGESAQEISEGLVRLASDSGSGDNITVILAVLWRGLAVA